MLPSSPQLLLLMVLGPAAAPELPPRPSDASVASDPLAEREVVAQDEALRHQQPRSPAQIEATIALYRRLLTATCSDPETFERALQLALARTELAAAHRALARELTRRFVAHALHIEAAELAETGLSETPLP